MPSLINTLMIDELRESTKGATALLLVDTSKLNSEDALKLRSGLRKLGAKLKVAKAAIVYRVLPEGLESVVPRKGSFGLVAAGSDIAAAAKLINELVKEEKVSLKGAILEGKPLSAKQAAGLADLPTREQANVLLIRTLSAPLTQLVRIVNAKPTELVRVIKVKSEEGAPS